MQRAIISVVLMAVSLGWVLTGTAMAPAEKAIEMDSHFVTKAANAGMAEVKLGKMATERAVSPAVKQFGQRMVTDHTKAHQELMTIAQGKNITVPTTMDAEHQEMTEGLAKFQGTSFDREFMRQMVTDHEKAVQLFSKQSEEGKDNDLKGFAAKTLPTLQEHLQMARDLAQQQGVSQVR